jgi:hypothetical protein
MLHKCLLHDYEKTHRKDVRNLFVWLDLRQKRCIFRLARIPPEAPTNVSVCLSVRKIYARALEDTCKSNGFRTPPPPSPMEHRRIYQEEYDSQLLVIGVAASV